MSAWGKPRETITKLPHSRISESVSHEEYQWERKLSALSNNVLTNNYLGKEPRNVTVQGFVCWSCFM